MTFSPVTERSLSDHASPPRDERQARDAQDGQGRRHHPVVARYARPLVAQEEIVIVESVCACRRRSESDDESAPLPVDLLRDHQYVLMLTMACIRVADPPLRVLHQHQSR